VNGERWSEDPQSISLTQSQLNSVAFAPTGEGWAVGANGTILRFDGRQWSAEQPPSTDSEQTSRRSPSRRKSSPSRVT
jgi:photosystem II stability/assembly factor-like uncharacterized protein